jgi:hypothetical protein
MAPTLAPEESRFKISMCSDLVGMAGFEPAASCSQSRRANQAAPHPVRPNVAYRPQTRFRGDEAVAPTAEDTGPGPSPGTGSASWLQNRYAVGAHPVPVADRSRRARGRSSMAEPQPSKLVMRVRFPSPAPTQNPRSQPQRRTGQTRSGSHARRSRCPGCAGCFGGGLHHPSDERYVLLT